MGKSSTHLQGVSVRNGRAAWTLTGDLGISRAAELLGIAKRLAEDDRIVEISIKLSDPSGVPLSTYQILKAMVCQCERKGVAIQFDGSILPYGGRTW